VTLVRPVLPEMLVQLDHSAVPVQLVSPGTTELQVLLEHRELLEAQELLVPLVQRVRRDLRALKDHPVRLGPRAIKDQKATRDHPVNQEITGLKVSPEFKGRLEWQDQWDNQDQLETQDWLEARARPVRLDRTDKQEIPEMPVLKDHKVIQDQSD
jgi:hypothetical protein